MRARLNRCWVSAALLPLDDDDDNFSLRLLNDEGEAADVGNRGADRSSVSWRSLVSSLSSSELEDTVVDELGDATNEVDDSDDTSGDRVPSWLWLAVLLALVAFAWRSKFKDDLADNSRRRIRRRMLSLPSLDSSSELSTANGKWNGQKSLIHNPGVWNRVRIVYDSEYWFYNYSKGVVNLSIFRVVRDLPFLFSPSFAPNWLLGYVFLRLKNSVHLR